MLNHFQGKNQNINTTLQRGFPPLPKSHAGAYSLQAEATELGSSGGGEPAD